MRNIKAMSDIPDPDIYSDVIINCKPPKSFDYPETGQSFSRV